MFIFASAVIAARRFNDASFGIWPRLMSYWKPRQRSDGQSRMTIPGSRVRPLAICASVRAA